MRGTQNIGSIFYSPDRVARSVSEEPNWLIPFLIFFAIIIIASYVTMDYQMESRLYEQVKDTQVDLSFLKSPAKRLIFSVFPAVSSLILVILIPAAVLNGVASIVANPIGFRRMFAFMCHVALIIGAGSVVQLLMMKAKGSFDVRLSPAAFFPNLHPGSSLMTLLSSFDIFSIWAVVAAIIGYKELARVTMRRAILIVLSLWFIAIAILVGLSSLRGSLGART